MKYILAWAKDEKIRDKSSSGGFVTSILKFVLDHSFADLVITVKKIDSGYELISTSDPKEVEECAGKIIYATPNIAKFLRDYVDTENKKVCVVCKPCDARGIVELGKRGLIKIENIIMIGLNCTGTFTPISLRKTLEYLGLEADEVEVYRDKLLVYAEGNTFSFNLRDIEMVGFGRRENCRRCEINIPRMCDLACGSWGVPKNMKATFVEILTDKGAEIINSAKDKGYIDFDDVNDELLSLRAEEERFALQMAKYWQDYYFSEIYETENRFEFWSKLFERCIKCYSCIESCPICFCTDCLLHPWRGFIEGAEIPPSMTFHIVRIFHIAESCVNCGQCQDSCAVDIPLSRIAHLANKEVQLLWEYIPGIDLKPPPLSRI